MISLMAIMLKCWASQTTNSTASVETTIQAMMNSMIASNMLSMQQSLQSPTTTMPMSTYVQQFLSASKEFRTPNDDDGDNESGSEDDE